eukprot:GEMP01004147.1.p1 GENE.GEMP01004147.1~~GEMP01004147.1.p1  ORF type:complete len:260 (+),score=42.06 GEMP01004147.1:182-961(+)
MLCINPLTVRFSQDRVRPTFQDVKDHKDGSSVQAAIDETVYEPFGDKQNLLFLRAPFEPIEILKWRPKIRSGAEEDKTGKRAPVYGEEKWFSLDNRRLYALQKKSVQLWPQRCLCEVKVVTNEATKRGKQLRKFKTKKGGEAVDIGYRDEEIIDVWDWRKFVDPPQVQDMEPVQMERAQWYYVGTYEGEETIQGPFDMEQMHIWHVEYPEYFTSNLPCRLDWYLEFYRIVDLYSGKSAVAPFTNYPNHPSAELNSIRLQ